MYSKIQQIPLQNLGILGEEPPESRYKEEIKVRTFMCVITLSK